MISLILSKFTWSLLNETQKEIVNNKNNFKVNQRLLKHKSKYFNKRKAKGSKEEVKEHTKFEDDSEDDKHNQEDEIGRTIQSKEEVDSKEPISPDAKANMYYDEIELKEKFDEEFEKYDSQEFIVDLITVLLIFFRTTLKIFLFNIFVSWLINFK